MARTMLNDSKLFDIFWIQAIHTSVHILNRGQIRADSNMTPCKLWKGRPTTVKHFRVFGSKCYIKRNDEYLGNLTLELMKGSSLGAP